MLSERINRLAESETLAMARKSRELKALGHQVINLSIGEPDFFTPDKVKAAAKQAIDNNESFYTPVNGNLDLREAICEKLKRDNQLSYQPGQVVVSTGAKQSIANALLCLVNPGDEVIMPAPYWVSYREMIKMAEGKEVVISTNLEQDYKITSQQLEAAITPASKVFIFSSPCNPSGSVYSRAELQALAEVFEKHPHIYIISDEIYELINFSGQHTSLAQFSAIHDRVVLVNGVSKGFAMTGWRLGYMAAHETIAQACTKFQGQVTSGTCSIAQKAALEAMRIHPSETRHMLEKFEERRDLLIGLLQDIPGINTNKPQGAFYLFPDVKAYFGKSDGHTTIEHASDLCMYILNKAYVAMVPGDAFGNPDCIRISYATSNELLVEAVNRLKQVLATLQ